MPNGYTAKIYDGSDVTLRGYLLGVARAMGYAVLQRDDSADVPVRKAEPTTRYHDESIDKARRRRDWLQTLDAHDAEREARAEHEAEHASWVESRDRMHEMQLRYETMIANVEGWHPDPLIESTKEVALKYLRESLEFDTYNSGPPVPQTGAAWLSQQLAIAERNIAYHEAERAKEIERTAERNRYIDAFYASLPAEPVAVDA